MKPGIYPIYKPKGPTSHDIIYKVRKLSGIKRVGHAGTLDPLASGVLVVAISREYTKRLGSFVEQEKEYVAELTLGTFSTTDDEQGEKIPVCHSCLEPESSNWIPDQVGDDRMNDNKEMPSRDDVRKVLLKFTGQITQLPPLFSAVKIQGKKAYELGRKAIGDQYKEFLSTGFPIESGMTAMQDFLTSIGLKPRTREVKSIEILDYNYPLLKLRIVTGKGVYIRALARDLGVKLGTGAYMSDLVRTRVGQYTINQAYKLL